MQTPLNRPLISRRFLLTLLSALLVQVAIAGCQGTHKPAEPALVRDLSTLVYPKDAGLGEDLDIMVIRLNARLDLVNRTPRSFNDVTLWVNQQYVGRPLTIPIGGPTPVDLTQYVNKHGEEYPVGTVLGPDLRFPVQLVELYDPATGKRHRLTVDMRR